MPAPSGFTDFQDAFVIVRSLPGDRLKIVNMFPLGQLAIKDAGERFADTGDEYTILRAIGKDFVTATSGILQNQINTIGKQVSVFIFSRLGDLVADNNGNVVFKI